MFGWLCAAHVDAQTTLFFSLSDYGALLSFFVQWTSAFCKTNAKIEPRLETELMRSSGMLHGRTKNNKDKNVEPPSS